MTGKIQKQRTTPASGAQSGPLGLQYLPNKLFSKICKAAGPVSTVCLQSVSKDMRKAVTNLTQQQLLKINDSPLGLAKNNGVLTIKKETRGGLTPFIYAARSRHSKDLLRYLSTHSSGLVRKLIVANPATPTSVLKILASDSEPNKSIREAALQKFQPAAVTPDSPQP